MGIDAALYNEGHTAGLQGPFDGRKFQASATYRLGYRDGEAHLEALAAIFAKIGFGPQV